MKAKTTVAGLITTAQLCGVWTHFLGGRTLPCTTKDCPGCEASMPRRWEAYIGLYTCKPSRHIILALTPGAAVGIRDTTPNTTTLRGIFLTATRIGTRNNARLKCECTVSEFAQVSLPPEPNIVDHLMHIWGLDAAHIGQDNPLYQSQVKIWSTEQPIVTHAHSVA